MSRTVQAWYNVYNLDMDNGLPFYRVSATVADSEVVWPVTQGNWALSFVEGPNGEVLRRLPYVVDPEVSTHRPPAPSPFSPFSLPSPHPFILCVVS
jgi:hypothetical protein